MTAQNKSRWELEPLKLTYEQLRILNADGHEDGCVRVGELRRVLDQIFGRGCWQPGGGKVFLFKSKQEKDALPALLVPAEELADFTALAETLSAG